MVDHICTINGQRVGVSVTRAMGFPTPDRFTNEDAINLLRKKLYGLIVSRNCVLPHLAFFKSILHVWCQSHEIADKLKRAYENLDIDDFGLDIKGVVILLLTVCEDKRLYTNKF